MLDQIQIFRLAAGRMEYLADRQSVIARNIANADTPGYVTRDLTPFNFESALANQSSARTPTIAPLGIVRTSAAHMADNTGVSAPPSSPRASAASSYGEKPDGNRVSLEEQMVKSADNANAFALVSAAYTKSIAIMKMSIDK